MIRNARYAYSGGGGKPGANSTGMQKIGKFHGNGLDCPRLGVQLLYISRGGGAHNHSLAPNLPGGGGGLFRQHIAKPPQPESVCIAINGSERKKMAVLGDEEVCID